MMIRMKMKMKVSTSTEFLILFSPQSYLISFLSFLLPKYISIVSGGDDKYSTIESSHRFYYFRNEYTKDKGIKQFVNYKVR